MKITHQYLSFVLAAAILGSIVYLTGCASNDTGKYQEIPVTSDPSGAIVKADNEDTITTPGKFYLIRNKRHTLVAKYPGCEPQKLILRNEAQGWVWGNFITGGLIDLVADSGSGSMDELIPKKAHFVFAQPAAEAAFEAKPPIQSEIPKDSIDKSVKPAAETVPEAKPPIQNEMPKDKIEDSVKPTAKIVYEDKPQIKTETPEDGNDIDFTPICSICGKKLTQKDGINVYRLKLACKKCFKKVTN
jgi:hypothetical protein